MNTLAVLLNLAAVILFIALWRWIKSRDDNDDDNGAAPGRSTIGFHMPQVTGA